MLRKAFEWTDKCQRAFEDLKAYLTLTLLLSPSKPGEELYLYLAVSFHAMSLALIREEGKVQKPVSFKRSWRTVPTNEKVSLLIGNISKKAQALFPGSCH